MNIDEKKKIGIITHYYNSINFGGNLQAYALARYLETQGYHAEQISYNFYKEQEKREESSVFRKAFIKARRVIRHPIRVLILNPKYKRAIRKNDGISKQNQAINEFNRNKVPHSAEVYTRESIKGAGEKYDVFITGSDQVWNFSWYHSAFFLDFVPDDKPKLSYAASVGMDTFTEEQKTLVREKLKDFAAISVREHGALDLLYGLTPTAPICVVDPVLLLDRKEWDTVCAPRQLEENYVFCYFLGNNKKERKIAKRFARKKRLPLVNVFMQDKIADVCLGDECLSGVGPAEFISLIKHAEYVLTDSFHAVVFSHIYHKQYFVFNRDKNASMSSRITHITELFHTADRYCREAERENLNYLLALEDIDYTREYPAFNSLKQESVEFLSRNLSNDGEKD